MASVVAQIKVRQGNLADLPILQPGEFGYATDTSRLYIGNVPPTAQAGDGTTTIFTFNQIDTDSDGTTDNNATLDFGDKITYAVYLDDGTNDGEAYSAVSVSAETSSVNDVSVSVSAETSLTDALDLGLAYTSLNEGDDDMNQVGAEDSVFVVSISGDLF